MRWPLITFFQCTWDPESTIVPESYIELFCMFWGFNIQLNIWTKPSAPWYYRVLLGLSVFCLSTQHGATG